MSAPDILPEKVFGLEKNVFFAGLTSFFTDTSTKMLYSIMPLFLLSIGASKTTISLIEGIAESTASLLKALSGLWSDRIGKNKPFMIIGYGITAFITPLYSFTTSSLQILFLRFFERAGKGIRAAPRDSLISSSIKDNDAGKNYGFHKAMDNSGAIIGPLAAFLILYFFPLNYKAVFLLSFIPAIFGVITVIVFIHETKTSTKSNKDNVSIKEFPLNFRFFLFVIFIFSLGNSTDALLLVKTSETCSNPSIVPFLYMIYNTVSVLFAIPAGKISDKSDRKKPIIAGFLIYCVVYFSFGYFKSISIYVFLFVLYGIYSALTDTCQKALVSDLVSRNLKGTAFGLYHAVIGISLLPANLIAGFLYDKVSPQAPFYFGASASLCAAILMIIFTVISADNKTSK